jgi:hypothetical protein
LTHALEDMTMLSMPGQPACAQARRHPSKSACD